MQLKMGKQLQCTGHFHQMEIFLISRKLASEGGKMDISKNYECRSKKRWPISISELPEKRRGHPLKLGEQLDKEVQSFIKATQDSHGVVNTQIVMVTTRGVIMTNLFAKNGGYSNITKD